MTAENILIWSGNTFFPDSPHSVSLYIQIKQIWHCMTWFCFDLNPHTQIPLYQSNGICFGTGQ